MSEAGVARVDGNQGRAVLGAMTAVITAGQPGLGRELVDAAAELFYADAEPVAAIDTVEPDQLAGALASVGAGARAQAAELVAVAALAEATDVRHRLTSALGYADALGVTAGWVAELRLVAAGRVEEAMHDMVVRNAATFPGFAPPGEVPDLTPPYEAGSAANQRLAERFLALADYPVDSFGYAFWAHFRRHGFRFPGQPGALNAAFAVRHDGLHVLTGYDTSIQGEILVSTFTGRMHRTDAMSAHLLPVIFQWHVGWEVNGIGAQHGALAPAKFLYAWQRGQRCTIDVLDPSWDFFAVAYQPLADVRAGYGIADLPQRFRPSGPEVNLTPEADPSLALPSAPI